MRPHNVVNQQTTVLWSARGSAYREVRIARRWRSIIEAGERRDETRYRAETRFLGSDWLPVGDNADWLSGVFRVWARLDAAARSGRIPWLTDETMREIAWHTHCWEWEFGSDEVHEDAIFEDKVRTLTAVAGVDGLLEIVSRGELTEVLLSMRPAE
jgi:hypothetical protein